MHEHRRFHFQIEFKRRPLLKPSYDEIAAWPNGATNLLKQEKPHHC